MEAGIVRLSSAAERPVVNPSLSRSEIPSNVVPIRPPVRLAPSPGPHSTLLAAIMEALPRKRQKAVMEVLRRQAKNGDEHAKWAMDISSGFYGWTY